MTDKAQPGGKKTAPTNWEVSGVFRYAGGTEGWIVPDGETRIAQRTSLDTTNLNAFNASYASNSNGVTIEGGEGFIEGWLAKDTSTNVTLSFNATETVYVGWDATSMNADSVVVGKSGAFGDERSPRMAIWEFTTDDTGVTDATDLRQIGYKVSSKYGQIEQSPTNPTDVARKTDLDAAREALVRFKENYNELYQRVAEHDFELGLTAIDYENGLYDVLANTNKIASSTDLNTSNTGLESNGNGYVVVQDDSGTYRSSATFTSSTKDLGFTPTTAVVGQEASLPDSTDIQYTLKDTNGNTQTVTQSDVDSELDIADFSGSSVKVTIVLSADTGTNATPQLDSYAVYFNDE